MVRAPIEASVIKSAMYCGVIGSSISVAAGRPISAMRSKMRRAMRRPSLTSNVSSMMRIVDQPFPADRGARFFEIDAHQHEQAILHAARKLQQPLGVFQAGLFIVNGARADDHDQPRIVAGENLLDRFRGN